MKISQYVLVFGVLASIASSQDIAIRNRKIESKTVVARGSDADDLPAIAKVDPDLVKHSDSPELVDVFIVLADQPQDRIKKLYLAPASAVIESLHAAVARELKNPKRSEVRLKELVAERDRFEQQARRRTIDAILEAIQPEQDALTARLKSAGVVPGRTYWSMNMISARMPGMMIARVSEWPEVLSVKPSLRRDLAMDTSIKTTGAYAFHDAGIRGSTQNVLVLDSGISKSHPYFSGLDIEDRVMLLSASKRDCFNDNPSDTSDKLGHGTLVASILTSRDPAGMVPGLGRLISYKVVAAARNVAGCPSMLIEEADWIAAIEDAVKRFPIQVINMSLGGNAGTEDDLGAWVTDQIADTLDISIVAAAGNDGDSSKFYQVASPAVGPNVTAVGNINHNSTVTRIDDEPNPNSSKGPTPGGRLKPDLAAPGTAIVGADAGSSGPSQPGTGSSFAAPHVAGGFALLADGGIRSSLQRRAVMMNSTDSDTFSRSVGFGQMNLDRAFAQREWSFNGALKLAGGRYVILFAGNLNGAMRTTMVWNRHIRSVDATANRASWYQTNLNLTSYISSDARWSYASAGVKDNAERISFTEGTAPVVFKIDVPPNAAVSGDEEPFAIAFSDPSVHPVFGPDLEVGCTPDRSQAMQLGAVNLDCTVKNKGDLDLPPNALTRLFYRNPWTKQERFFELPGLRAGAEVRQRITLALPVNAVIGKTQVDLAVLSQAYGEDWFSEAQANAFTVIAPAVQDCTPEFRVNATFPLSSAAQTFTVDLKFPGFKSDNPGFCNWTVDAGSFVRVYNAQNSGVTLLNGSGGKTFTFVVPEAKSSSLTSRSQVVDIPITSRIEGSGAPSPVIVPKRTFTVTQTYSR